MNSSVVQELASYNLSNPSGIAVDWVADNIYWTDAGRKVIEVARIKHMYRKIIITNYNKQELRAIAVYPSMG